MVFRPGEEEGGKNILPSKEKRPSLRRATWKSDGLLSAYRRRQRRGPWL